MYIRVIPRSACRSSPVVRVEIKSTFIYRDCVRVTALSRNWPPGGTCPAYPGDVEVLDFRYSVLCEISCEYRHDFLSGYNFLFTFLFHFISIFFVVQRIILLNFYNVFFSK